MRLGGECLVSVIIPVFNDGRWLRYAVRSIQAQSYGRWELVIVDDGSDADTRAAVAAIGAEDDRVVVIQQRENQGLTHALNVGLGAAQGDLMLRQDADEISVPSRMATQVELLRRHPAIGVLGSTAIQKGPRASATQPVNTSDGGDPEAVVRIVGARELSMGNPVPHGTLCIRREIMEELDGYDETFECAQDYDLLVRALPMGAVGYTLEPLVLRWSRESSVSAKKRRRQRLDAARALYHGVAAGTLGATAVLGMSACLGRALVPNVVARGLRRARGIQ